MAPKSKYDTEVKQFIIKSKKTKRMKNQLLTSIMIATAAFVGMSQSSNAQALFKDMEPGKGVSSNPQQFTNVNGIVYFITDPSTTRRHALWKTDGTVQNTVMVKDSIINTAVTDRFMIRGQIGDTLYYTVNINVQSDTTTELWMVKNGSTPVLVTLLKSKNVNAFSNGEPRYYAVAGHKLYFQMYTSHGYELWVSNGTEAGTFEVVDLFPGSTSGIANGGANPVPMFGYKGKIYFQGITSFTGDVGLYSSDGTPGGTKLLKAGPKFDPQFFMAYNNELYFQAKTGLWKTDGTVTGTVNFASVGFNSDVRIFKNEMFYSVGSTMFKSNGTLAGTAPFKDSVGIIIGMNDDYFLTRYMRLLTKAPYYEYYYWRSDGTPTGTVRVADTMVNASSFAVLNNKMYGAVLGNALWESDGKESGTRKLLTGIVNYPFILNNTVFFSNWGSGTDAGYELWSYTPSGGGSIPTAPSNLTVVPQKKQDAKKLKLTWKDNSSDELGFIIARSLDGISFSLIDTVSPNITTYTDTGLIASTMYYYQVAAYNTTGNSAYTATISSTTLAKVNEIINTGGLRVYPNPSSGLFTITFNPSFSQPRHLKVTDMIGNEVYSEILAKGVNSYSLNLVDLPNGVYFLYELNGGVHKLIIEK